MSSPQFAVGYLYVMKIIRFEDNIALYRKITIMVEIMCGLIFTLTEDL